MYLSIMRFEARDFRGSNSLWDYVVVNALLRSYIIHHDQSGFSRPNHKGKRGKINNIHNVVNNEEIKAINISKA